jgi:hypothetical protein
MDRVTLGTAGDAVVQDGVTESYSDVQPVKGGRHVAGAFIGFQLKVEEAIVRQEIGTAATVSVETHPALI